MQGFCWACSWGRHGEESRYPQTTASGGTIPTGTGTSALQMKLQRIVESRRQAQELPDGLEAVNEVLGVAKSCGK